MHTRGSRHVPLRRKLRTGSVLTLPAQASLIKNTHLLAIKAIPARGFTAAVSVFGGTPPPKPLNCRPAQAGAPEAKPSPVQWLPSESVSTALLERHPTSSPAESPAGPFDEAVDGGPYLGARALDGPRREAAPTPRWVRFVIFNIPTAAVVEPRREKTETAVRWKINE